MGKVEKCVVYDLMKMRLEEEAADPARIDFNECRVLMGVAAEAVQRGSADNAFSSYGGKSEYDVWLEIERTLNNLGIRMDAWTFIREFVEDTLELLELMEVYNGKN